jgi:flavin-dependent thymidylate synthase
MYSLDDIRVELLNPEEVKNFIRNHGVFACQCYMTPEKYAEKVGMSCLREGHTSGSRADMFKFRIYCPRYCADQIMRHSVGTAINCQSQRYVDMDDNFSIYVPPKVMADDMLRQVYEDFEYECKKKYNQVRLLMEDRGVKGEKANDLMRTMLPIGVGCNLTMGFTVEALIHFMHKRLCVRADEPIRQVAKLMREVVLEVEPRYEELLVPQCKNLMYCPEKHSCHLYPSREEVEELIKRCGNCCKDCNGCNYNDNEE